MSIKEIRKKKGGMGSRTRGRIPEESKCEFSPQLRKEDETRLAQNQVNERIIIVL